MTDNYEKYYERFMGMKKMDIIREGITWGIWAGYTSTIDHLMKHWKKYELAGHLADRLVRLELRGY